MEKTKVFLRYCGGCNPRYDRVALVKELAAAMPEATFRFGPGAGEAPVLLAVCGCTAQCLTLAPAETEGKTVLWLAEPPDVDALAEQLRKTAL